MSTPVFPNPGNGESTPVSCRVPQGWPSPDCEVLDQLMALADRYRQSGLRRQAMVIWWSLVRRHAHTTHARSARVALMQLALQYESEGMHLAAREIFEHLLVLEREGDHARR